MGEFEEDKDIIIHQVEVKPIVLIYRNSLAMSFLGFVLLLMVKIFCLFAYIFFFSR